MTAPQVPSLSLSDLLSEFVDLSYCPETVINGLTLDSRDVKPGDLFIAVKGTQTDGASIYCSGCRAGRGRGTGRSWQNEPVPEHGQLSGTGDRGAKIT